MRLEVEFFDYLTPSPIQPIAPLEVLSLGFSGMKMGFVPSVLRFC